MGCHSSAYVPFLFIKFKHRLYAPVKLRIYPFKPCGNVLMNRTFAYPKYFSCISYSCLIFNDILCEAYTSFLFRSIGAVICCCVCLSWHGFAPPKLLIYPIICESCKIYDYIDIRRQKLQEVGQEVANPLFYSVIIA